jgi:hypothetical protein
VNNALLLPWDVQQKITIADPLAASPVKFSIHSPVAMPSAKANYLPTPNVWAGQLRIPLRDTLGTLETLAGTLVLF